MNDGPRGPHRGPTPTLSDFIIGIGNPQKNCFDSRQEVTVKTISILLSVEGWRGRIVKTTPSTLTRNMSVYTARLDNDSIMPDSLNVIWPICNNYISDDTVSGQGAERAQAAAGAAPSHTKHAYKIILIVKSEENRGAIILKSNTWRNVKTSQTKDALLWPSASQPSSELRARATLSCAEPAG